MYYYISEYLFKGHIKLDAFVQQFINEFHTRNVRTNIKISHDTTLF